ncbi:uncharacterized protein LOC126921130 [Bombus affinis]|uniref:uncharacterized protein LOC126921130 n=1 Tax=Bombus affinis TaxID=309941 RepID=UPI0021B6FA87|nr:uncharacterized protein LOC126921130 [Bombus affinis]
MKLLWLFTLGCTVVVVLSGSTDSNEKALRARASAQLERLAPYRRTSTDQGTIDEQWQLLENAANNPAINKLSDQQVLEIYRLLPENLQRDVIDRVGGNRAMIEMLANQKYMAFMQDRIKRSGSKREIYDRDGYESPPDGYAHEYTGYGHNTYGEHDEGNSESSGSGSDSGSILKGSGSLIGGIAKGIISGLVSASSSASKGSSSISAQSSQTSSGDDKPKPKPEYGQVYSYNDKAFDMWDFKKAIITTLMQAVKAISGGVIALKGQLLKGGAYLVAAKSKIITKTGDAITTLGRNIVKSAVHPPQPHPGYLYDHPPEGGHEESYDGPPPSIEEYGEPHDEYQENGNYDSSSDVAQAGLLIVKPTKPDDYGYDQHTADLDAQKPAVTHSEDNYYGPPPELSHEDIGNTVLGNANSYQNFNQHDHNVNSNSVPPLSGYDHVKGLDYTSLASGSPSNHHSPLSIQQNVEYPPIHIQYSLPDKGNLQILNGDTSGNDLSVYSSLSIDTDPRKIESIKISAELPKLQPHTNLQNLPLLPYSYPLQEPLKIPLWNPHISSPYWQNQGLLQPYANFNLHGLYRRRSSSQRRRSVSEIAQRMRLQRG